MEKQHRGRGGGGIEGERERGGGRGHCTVWVNHGTHKLPSLDHHPNDSG